MQEKNVRVVFIILAVAYVAYLLWWIIINLFVPRDSAVFDYFTDSYGVIACLGSIAGFDAARKWGGLSSVLGKALFLFSTGLLFQFLGQVSYAVYFYVYNIDNPYPSFGEIFYFGGIPVYIIAVWFLGKASGSEISLKAMSKKIISIILPLSMMTGSYIVFLRNYEVDPTNPLITFLDFGYPLGEAAFVALAILAFFLSKRWLGGTLKNSVLLILFALVIQYVADTHFLYQTFNDTWRAGGLNDMIFMTAYFAMGNAFIKFSGAATDLVAS